MDIDVICLGHCAWDLLTVVRVFPRVDSKVEALRFFEQGGGPAATAAVTLSRLGAKVACIGKVGDDRWGQKIVEGLIEERVAPHGLIVEQDASSPLSIIIVEKETGKRTIIHSRGTVHPLSEEDLNIECLSSAKILLIDSLHPCPALSAAKWARERGMLIVLDTGAFKPQAVDLLEVSDVIIAPEYFATQFGPGKAVADVANELLDFGSEIVVFTRGERGGICFTRNEEFPYPGFQVEVVDTTGAGDVFHGAFAFGVLKGWNMKRISTFASAVAALKCARLGGRTGIPSLQGTVDFLRERKLWDS